MALASAARVFWGAPRGGMSVPVLDIRTYALVPGSGAEFDRLFRERSQPLLERFGIQTVAHGLSLSDTERYVLIRRFASARERDERLESFYGSDAWSEIEPDVLPLIETYHVVLITE